MQTTVVKCLTDAGAWIASTYGVMTLHLCTVCSVCVRGVLDNDMLSGLQPGLHTVAAMAVKDWRDRCRTMSTLTTGPGGWGRGEEEGQALVGT